MSAVRPNPNQPRSSFDEEAMASLTASIREVGVLQPVLVRPVGRRRVRAGGRGAPLAGGPARRPAGDPRARPHRRRHRHARAGAGREPAARGPQPARRGGRLPAADRGLPPHPRGGRHPGGQEPGGDLEHPAPVPAARPASRSSWPRASWPPATPGRCSARPTAASRRRWPAGPSPRGCRCGRWRTRCASTARGTPAPRRERTAQARRLRAPGLLELEELLSDPPRHPREGGDGRRARAGCSSSSPPSRTSSASTGR